MFDNEFFPTPEDVIAQMVSPYLSDIINSKKNGNFSILEPSAGKGDILQYIVKQLRYSPKMYAIESNLELAEIVKSKGFKVISNDFLKYSGSHFFDLIVMNPPFSNGDEHLLKAWEILKEGKIVCLLNEETIKNPYSKTRKLLEKIIKDNGTVEYIGSAFANAERKTDVGVALVRLEKKDNSNMFDFTQAAKTKLEDVDFSEENLANGIARISVIDTVVGCYDGARDAIIDLIKAYNKLQSYTKPLNISDYSLDADKIIFKDSGDSNVKYNNILDNLNSAAWATIISKGNMEKYFTSNMKSNFSKFIQQQGSMDFTKENIESLFNLLFNNKDNILENCLIDTFDRLCSYDIKNKVHVEGWKTNDAYKVNMKVIIPWGISDGDNRFGLPTRISYRGKADMLDDIDKVLSYLTGNSIEKISKITTVIDKHLGDSWTRFNGDEIESEYFKIKYYKKGTIHLKFKDVKLWERFNVAAAKGKNWLPD